jgi:hypothetical protein
MTLILVSRRRVLAYELLRVCIQMYEVCSSCKVHGSAENMSRIFAIKSRGKYTFVAYMQAVRCCLKEDVNSRKMR